MSDRLSTGELLTGQRNSGLGEAECGSLFGKIEALRIVRDQQAVILFQKSQTDLE